MNKRDLILFLVLEVIAIIWAGAVFSLFTSRLLAGALAGSYFVLSAAFMIWRASRWRDKWLSPTWYLLLIHLFGISLPMVITRFLNARYTFTEVRIWGLPGPVFHSLSTGVFSCLLAATVIDLIRAGLRERSPKKT